MNPEPVVSARSLAIDRPFTVSSEGIASQLYDVLRRMDPAKWRDEGAPAIRVELLSLQASMRALEISPTAEQRVLDVRGRFLDLAQLIEQRMPALELPRERLRAAWQELRRELVPAYEKLAQSLVPIDVRVPSLRPTNYARNVYHFMSGMVVIALLRVILPEGWPVWVALGFASLAWTVELLRRRATWLNVLMMTLFRPFAHPHEAWRINSATWFTTAILGLALLDNVLVTTIALAVLAAGDPVAALIGRRFGRTRLANGRSLEGTLAFVVAAATCATGVLQVFHAEMGLGRMIVLAFAGAIPGAIAELLTRRVDDNLAIPWSAAAGVLAASALLT